MIKFENTEVWGIKHAIRGMRNPLSSWDKSDSHYEFREYETDENGDFKHFTGNGIGDYIIGPNDLALCQRLINGGPEHRKFLRQIMVSVDITAPLYWWKEFDTYKVGTVANSCSTMHTIHKKEFTLEDFSWEQLLNNGCDLFEVEKENGLLKTIVQPQHFLIDYIIPVLNKCRELYLQTKDKKFWWQMIQLLPSSYNQKRTVTLNYENLRSIYFQRRNHKLDEWSEGFIKWVEGLPYAGSLITCTLATTCD